MSESGRISVNYVVNESEFNKNKSVVEVAIGLEK